jgi:hypothetical protein
MERESKMVADSSYTVITIHIEGACLSVYSVQFTFTQTQLCILSLSLLALSYSNPPLPTPSYFQVPSAEETHAQ